MQNSSDSEYVITTLLLFMNSLHLLGYTKIAHALATYPIADWEVQSTHNIESIARFSAHLDKTKLYTKANEPQHMQPNTQEQHSATRQKLAAQASMKPNLKHHLVGRIKTITGRDLRQHDVEAELEMRSSVTRAHAYATTDNSCDCWTRDLMHYLCRNMELALNSAPSEPQSFENWWNSRAVWLSSGTATTKPNTQSLATLLQPKNIRRTKSLLISHMTKQVLMAKVTNKPPIMVCRAATKNEPGHKRRPLRAADDTSYLIAAFASNNIEKYYNMDGSILRQTPNDVQEACQIIRRIPGQATRKYILCIDYSDFNNTHTIRARYALSVAAALAYTKRGNHQQAAAALWVAQAHLNHYASGARIDQGLSSGERDTARDNTILHSAYAALVQKALSARHPAYKGAIFNRKCGDDEIAVGITWSDAVLYYSEHMAQGHAMQQRKMMVSTQTGEFLQYNMYSEDNELPYQPLPPALNNFVSGSWYKTANYSASEYPHQVAEAAASCVRRGADLDMMQALAINTCNWLCKDKAPWKRLLMATNLFGHTVLDPPKPETTHTTDIGGLARLTQPGAIEEYVALINTRYALAPEHISLVRAAAAKNIFSTYMADVRSRADTFSEEDALRVELPPPIKMPKDILALYLSANLGTRTDPKTWLALQLGLPLELIQAIGMHNIINKATNAMRSHINTQPDIRKRPLIPAMLARLPGAILPAFTTTTMS
jgi:hypothetical protein